MKEQKFAVSIFGRETTIVLTESQLPKLLKTVKEKEDKIEFIYDLDEYKSMYPMSI